MARELYIFAGQSNATPNPEGQGGTHGPFIQRLSTLRPDTEIVVIPTAVGGSKMETWFSWGANYRAMLAAVATALDSGGTIKGVVWWQGESDCGRYQTEPYDAWPSCKTWSFDFARLVGNLRADLGIPNLPIVFAQLGPEPQGIWDYAAWGYLQSKQNAISIANVSMVRTSDQSPRIPNDVHLSSAGYAVVGERFANTMNTFL